MDDFEPAMDPVAESIYQAAFKSSCDVILTINGESAIQKIKLRQIFS